MFLYVNLSSFIKTKQAVGLYKMCVLNHLGALYGLAQSTCGLYLDESRVFEIPRSVHYDFGVQGVHQ